MPKTISTSFSHRNSYKRTSAFPRPNRAIRGKSDIPSRSSIARSPHRLVSGTIPSSYIQFKFPNHNNPIVPILPVFFQNAVQI